MTLPSSVPAAFQSTYCNPSLGSSKQFWNSQPRTLSLFHLKRISSDKPSDVMPGIPPSDIPVLLATAWSNHVCPSKVRCGNSAVREKPNGEEWIEARKIHIHASLTSISWLYVSVEGESHVKMKVFPINSSKSWPDCPQEEHSFMRKWSFSSLPPVLLTDLTRGSLQMGRNELSCELLHILCLSICRYSFREVYQACFGQNKQFILFRGQLSNPTGGCLQKAYRAMMNCSCSQTFEILAKWVYYRLWLQLRTQLK